MFHFNTYFFLRWLEKLFGWTPFKNAIRLIVFLLTLSSLLFSFYYVIRYRNEIHGQNTKKSTLQAAYIFCLAMIMGNIILHAPFLIATRYALPIAPLYLILIALNAQHFCAKR